jgi:hypothetical protein
MELQKGRCENDDHIPLAQGKVQQHESLSSLNGRESLEWLSKYQILKDSDSWT